jgi:hypothetical protein
VLPSLYPARRYFSGTPAVLTIGSANAFFDSIDISLFNTFQDTEHVSLTETSRRLEDGSYEFEFPDDWMAQNKSYIRSLEILAMNTFGTSDVAHEQFNTRMPTTTEIDFKCMLGFCGNDDVDLEVDMPEMSLEVFFDGASDAAASITTDAIDWWSGTTQVPPPPPHPYPTPTPPHPTPPRFSPPSPPLPLSQSGQLWLDSTLDVMNEQGGFIDEILAIVNGKSDVTMSIKGAMGSMDSFMARVLAKLSFNLAFDSKASAEAAERRRLDSPLDLHPRALAFLERYNRDSGREGHGRALNAYVGDEELGLHTDLASSDTEMSLANTVFVWPHM